MKNKKLLALLGLPIVFAVSCSKPEDKKSSDDNVTSTAANRSVVTSSQCQNKIMMSAGDGETVTSLKEIIDGSDGVYRMIENRFFVTLPDQTQGLNRVFAAHGEDISNRDDGATEFTFTDKVSVDCFFNPADQNGKPVALKGSMRMPVQISLKDGQARPFREEQVEITGAGEQIKRSSKIQQVAESLKEMIDTEPPAGVSFLALKRSNQDLVFRMKIDRPEIGASYLEAVYRKVQ